MVTFFWDVLPLCLVFIFSNIRVISINFLINDVNCHLFAYHFILVLFVYMFDCRQIAVLNTLVKGSKIRFLQGYL